MEAGGYRPVMGERTVNARQLEVLQWVVAGCPAGVMTDTTYKTTAVALQNRRLVTVSKKKGVWRASPTDAGRHFAQHGAYPAGHWTSDTTAGRAPDPAAVAPLKRERERQVTGLRPVDQMLADIMAAGGSLDVTDTNGYYEGLVSSATRYGKVPAGQLLQIEPRRGYGEKTLRLVDKPSWMSAVVDPIPIPDRLTKPHPAVVSLRADREHRLPFKREVRQRALLLLDAVAKEATRRGYAVTCPRSEPNQRHPVDALAIDINGHPHALHVREDTDKVPHEPTVKEIRDFERWGYPRIPKYDKVPAGRLNITITGGVPVRQSAFGDTKTINLGDRLAVLLQELELRAANAEDRRLRAQHDAGERRAAWERIRQEAVDALREDHRAKTLAQQVGRWSQAQALIEYLAAMETHVVTLTGDERYSADAWLTWARGCVTRLNPLSGKLALPPDPEPTPDALQPFMRGHSPYGPERMYDW